MATPSPVPSRHRAGGHPLGFARLAAAAAVVLVLLLVLPLVVIGLRVAQHPSRYMELGALIPLSWTMAAVAVLFLVKGST